MSWTSNAAWAALCALATTACSRGPVKHDTFHYATFPDLNLDAQDFAPGFEGDDFHVMASATKAIQRLHLDGENLVEDHHRIQGWGVASSYRFALAARTAFVFQLGGLVQLDLDRETVLRHRTINGVGLELNAANFVFFDSASGNVFAAMNHIQGFERKNNSVQLHKFHADLSSEILLTFPIHTDLYALSDGLIVCPPDDEPRGQRTPFRIFDPQGTAHPGAFQKTLNAIYDSGIRLTHPTIAWNERALWATSLRRPWALISHPAFANGPSSRTSVLTIADTPATAGIVFETRHPKNETIDALIVSPTHDLFFAAVQDSGHSPDSAMLWLGRVRRHDGQYRAECYRIKVFENLKYLTLSRDGSTLLFGAEHQNQSQVVGARLTDILADINKRYPEAKLDLDQLKAEVK